MIMESATQSGPTMTHEEFRVWLDGVGTDGRDAR